MFDSMILRRRAFAEERKAWVHGHDDPAGLLCFDGIYLRKTAIWSLDNWFEGGQECFSCNTKCRSQFS